MGVDNGKIINRLDSLRPEIMRRDPWALGEYKRILSARSDVWIEPPTMEHMQPRIQWTKGYLDALGICKNSKILDIGSWTGTVANELYMDGYKNITCLDISTEVIRMGRETFPHLTWIQGDVERLSDYGNFDTVLMLEVLEHLIDPIRVIRNFKNTLIIFTVPTEQYVFDEGRAREHISCITRKDLDKLNASYSTIDLGDYAWYTGHILPNSKEEV